MNRPRIRTRRFPCSAAALLSLTLLIAAAMSGCSDEDAGEDAPIEMRYANFPPPSTFPCVQMDRWVEQIQQRTGGKVEVATYPSGQILGAKQIFDGISQGTAQVGCAAMSYQPGRFPVSAAMDLPHAWPSAEVASLVLYDLLQKRQPEEFADYKIVTAFTCPPTHLMTSGPVRNLEAMQGLPLRCSGTAAEAIQRIGARPVAMPMSDTLTAIEKGTVQGIVSSLEVLKDIRFASYCPHVTRVGPGLPVISFAVVMDRAYYDSLPEDVRKAIDELGREHARWTGRYVDQHVIDAIAWSKENHGLEVHELPAEEVAIVQQKLAPMIEEYVQQVGDKGLDGREILADIAEIRSAVEAEVAASPANAQ